MAAAELRSAEALRWSVVVTGVPSMGRLLLLSLASAECRSATYTVVDRGWFASPTAACGSPCGRLGGVHRVDLRGVFDCDRLRATYEPQLLLRRTARGGRTPEAAEPAAAHLCLWCESDLIVARLWVHALR